MDKPSFFTVTSKETAKVMAVVTHASDKILLIDSFWLSTGTNAEVYGGGGGELHTIQCNARCQAALI